ncbi:MAG: GNAT family N-acetyltransferase [Pseudomonadota bacterium]|nr:GNAT family N-acetyltransferase [Pseudomonadota bacterium]
MVKGGEEPRIALTWDDATPRAWDRWLSAAGQSTIEQSWAYGMAMAQTTPYNARTLTLRRGREVVAFALVFTWTLAGVVRIAKIVRGPLFLNPPEPATRHAVFAAIKAQFPRRKLNFFTWMPELPAAADSDQVMAALAMRRVVTGYGTIWLDLAQSLETLRAGFDGKWRNQLRRAEAADLDVRVSQGGAALEWLLQRHDAHRQERRFRAPAGAFVRAIASHSGHNKRAIRVLSAHHGSETLAAVLFLRHGDSATYYIGYSGGAGRTRHAHNLLLWQGLARLKDDLVAWLDLGGIDGRRMAGVSRFKLGLGGCPVTLAGTYL